ncbi:hypothetical protein T10_8213, partial [Trichinella papuae]
LKKCNCLGQMSYIQLKEIEKVCGGFHPKNMTFQLTMVYSSLRRFVMAEEENYMSFFTVSCLHKCFFCKTAMK